MRRLATGPDQKTLGLITLLALSIMVGFYFFLQVHDRPLQPYTIVDFELAWTPGRAAQLLAAWGPAGAQTARESLWVDFGFIPPYALFFAGATLLAARTARGRWQTIGLWLTLGPFVAGALDAAENLCLLNVLSSAAPSAVVLLVAGLAAAIKLLIVLVLCPVYVLGVVGVYVKNALTHVAAPKGVRDGKGKSGPEV
jgi:hypothetical protein